MSTVAQPPRHIAVFAISVTIIVVMLIGFLFAVSLEAKVDATGIVTARDLLEIRARHSGFIEFVDTPHRLDPGMELTSGTEWARLRRPEMEVEHYLALPTQSRWKILAIHADSGRWVTPGTPLMTVVPINVETNEIANLEVKLMIPEKNYAPVQVGQEVRLTSTIYPHRLYGHASGIVDRLEPMAQLNDQGARVFFAVVRVTESPFSLPIGSSVQAEIVTGHKPTYRIILEH